MNYAPYIDHTLLKMDATADDICKICDEAKQYHFFSVCVNSAYVPLVKKQLQGSGVKVCSVIGFPFGACLTEVKAFEASQAINAGAQEIDMVINLGFYKSGNLAAFKNDILAVKTACADVLLKVIFETCLLDEKEIKDIASICKELKVDYVKTSTGFSAAGASAEAVAIMRETVGNDIGVKASGGIRDQRAAQKMIDAGASRLGTSAGVTIINNKSND